MLKSTNSIETAWAYASAHIASLASRYPKSLAASVSLGLAGFAATAFGVSPMVPDPAALPKRIVSENVPTLDVNAQLEALAGSRLDLFRDDLTVPATTPIPCSPVSASATPRPPPSCAPTRSPASCSTAVPASACRCAPMPAASWKS